MDNKHLNVGDWWEEGNGCYVYVVANSAGCDGKVRIMYDHSDVPSPLLIHILKERGLLENAKTFSCERCGDYYSVLPALRIYDGRLCDVCNREIRQSK